MSQATDPANQTDAQKGLDGLNALLQHRSRLGALVLLSDADAISFTPSRIAEGNRRKSGRPTAKAGRGQLRGSQKGISGPQAGDLVFHLPQRIDGFEESSQSHAASDRIGEGLIPKEIP